MSATEPDHRLILVGGLHRSGTTLLADLLGAHPDATSLRKTHSPRDEGQFVQDVYPKGSESGGPGRFAFGAGAHLTEADIANPAEARARLMASWSNYWDMTKPVLVEKSPPNIVRFRYLQAIFPDADFIAIVRHPVAVAYATRPWTGRSMSRLIEHWTVAHEQFEADRPHIERLQFVRYEDLARDAPAVLTALDESIGLSPHLPAEEIRRDTNDRYLRAWWKSTALAPASLRVKGTARRFEDRIAALGYGYSLFDRPPD